MTVEKLESNGNSSPADEEKATTSRAKTAAKTSKAKEEVVALSVKNADDEKGLKLAHGSAALPGNRPVEASHLHIISTYRSVGGMRPVTASGMEVSGTLAISGNRPIAASHLQVHETYTVMGNRPVASNEIDDPAALMGFLD
ncbi:hypothetical protein [Chroococcus sp. FPU101]|uniref:hypothetical protein n=1 Tax=Chroococcus sp. FPU101 TaxID=1974212 RepID=UPI001A8E4EAC|nr:hypothetical protein [Chroococcus sp. FPU101]GFE71868.1 hypothetical protein CFPU101_44780 [Chroococcus sp. FPU101]